MSRAQVVREQSSRWDVAQLCYRLVEIFTHSIFRSSGRSPFPFSPFPFPLIPTALPGRELFLVVSAQETGCPPAGLVSRPNSRFSMFSVGRQRPLRGSRRRLIDISNRPLASGPQRDPEHLAKLGRGRRERKKSGRPPGAQAKSAALMPQADAFDVGRAHPSGVPRPRSLPNRTSGLPSGEMVGGVEVRKWREQGTLDSQPTARVRLFRVSD